MHATECLKRTTEHKEIEHEYLENRSVIYSRGKRLELRVNADIFFELGW